MTKWFNKNLQFSLNIEPTTARFLAHKAFSSSKLVASKSRMKYKKLLLETLARLESDDEEDNKSSSSSNYTTINEDDCHGISL